MGSCIGIPLFVLSLVAQIWLLAELDAGRDTCEELVYESAAALGANALLIVLGCLRSVTPSYMAWFDGLATLALTSISAVVVILASRVTLFVHEANAICAADVTANTTLPKTDVLRDVAKREMLGGLSWAALILFGAAVLLQHSGSLWSDDTYDYDRTMRSMPNPSSRRRAPRRF